MLGRPIRVPDLHTGRWHVPQYLIWVQSVPNHMLSERGDFCRLIRAFAAPRTSHIVRYVSSSQAWSVSGSSVDQGEVPNDVPRSPTPTSAKLSLSRVHSAESDGVHRSVSRQIHENPLMAILVGYVAGCWIHRGSGPEKSNGLRRMTKLPSQIIRCPMESTRRPCHTHPTICWRRLISPPPSDQLEHLGFGRRRTHSVAAPTGSPHAS